MFASKRTTALLSVYSAGVLNRCPDPRATATGVWQPTPVLGKALEDHMSDGLKWARRLRLELAVEIQQLLDTACQAHQQQGRIQLLAHQDNPALMLQP